MKTAEVHFRPAFFLFDSDQRQRNSTRGAAGIKMNKEFNSSRCPKDNIVRVL